MVIDTSKYYICHHMIPESNQIELRHLRYFMAVAEELHFRKAAQRLFISQPGLSRQIAQLEQVLGTKLFNREQRKVTLTKSGEHFKNELQQLLSKLDLVFDQLKFIETGEEGELRIGFVGSAMQEIIPNALLHLNEKYPNLHASLNEMSNWDQIESLLHHKLDIGFVRLSEVPEPLSLQNVFSDTFSLVVPEGHWLKNQNLDSLLQLKDEHFILFSSGYSHGYYDHVMSIFEDHGFTPKVSHRSVHANTIFRLVENNLGIAIVPTSLQHGYSLNVRFIELTLIPQRTSLSVAWRKTDTNQALKNFLEIVFKEK